MQRFTNIDVDRFFRSLDRLEPLYDENKVHQLINSPEATARLKGKSFKPLNIIIMTTLFVAIITAIFLWPGKKPSAPELVFNSEQTQISTSASPEEYINTKTDAINKSKTLTANDNEEIINYEDQSSTVFEASNSTGNNTIENSQNSTSPTIEFTSTSALTSEIKTEAPPKTIKGDIKMVVADQALLEKLGFQFIDGSVYYKNKWGEQDHEQAQYMYQVIEGGKVTYMLNTQIYSIEETPAITTSLNFYPIAEAYRSGKLVAHMIKCGDLTSANDTLFPIYCQQGLVSYEPNDIIFWFHITDDFIQKLPHEKLAFAEKIEQLKPIKRKFPELNLVDYSQDPLIDSSSLIELYKQEIFKLGFSLEQGPKFVETPTGRIDKISFKYTMVEDSATFGVSYNLNGSETFWNDYSNSLEKNPKLVFVTNIYGDFITKIVENKDLMNSREMIPIIIHKEMFSEAIRDDRVYWFEISDKLFKALPERISKDLQEEYNYIIAENKEDLVQPECKYFDECKNTLINSNFKVFPNPANQNTTVSFTLSDAITGRISLVDLAGRERQVLLPETTLSKGFQRFEFDLAGVSEGMYLITLYSNQGFQMQRLLISH